MDASLAKVESEAKYWKQEAQADVEKIEQEKKKRDEAKQEAKVACLAAMTVGEAKARAEDDLAKMRDALAIVEEDRQGLEAEVGCLTVEQTSLLLEL